MSQRANSSAFVVYDSPLKTMSELTEALELGAAVRQTRECWFVLAHFLFVAGERGQFSGA